jgi:Subtilase family
MNRSTRSLRFALLAMLGLSGSPAAFGSCLEHPRSEPVDLEPRRACSDDEWVALVDGGKCPTIGGFEGKSVFEEPLAVVRERTFCRFVWKPKGNSPFADDPTLDDIALLRSSPREPKRNGLVPRCGVVAALQEISTDDTTDLTKMTADLLAREFLLQVGKTQLPLRADATPTTRLTLVDSHKDGDGPPGKKPPERASGHGYALAHMVRAIVCNDGTANSPCAAQLATRLALPLRRNNDPSGSLNPMVAHADGGHFGTPLDLALALDREIRDWRKRGTAEHLILNLSLGWDHDMLTRGLGAVGEDGLNAEELAVLAILEEAALDPNILVLAAAGNGGGRKLGKVNGEGPLWPAAWSIRTPSSLKLITPSSQKLVWAIGAVDRRNGVLSVARPRSTPPLVAYGDHAVARDLNGELTDVLTGTSVSTAVASAIAAIVWEMQPRLTAREVMNLLFESAQPLSRKADHYRDGLHKRPALHRLSAAATLSRAWAPVELRAKVSKYSPDAEWTCNGSPLKQAKRCGEKVYVCRPKAASEAPSMGLDEGCPLKLFPSVQQAPWMLPQPGQNQCPSCSVDGGPPPTELRAQAAKSPDEAANRGWTLLLSRPPLGEAPCLTDLRLDIVSLSGKIQPAMVFPGQKLCRDPHEGGPIRVERLPLPEGLTIGSATLSFRYGNQRLSGKISLYHNEKPTYLDAP